MTMVNNVYSCAVDFEQTLRGAFTHLVHGFGSLPCAVRQTESHVSTGSPLAWPGMLRYILCGSCVDSLLRCRSRIRTRYDAESTLTSILPRGKSLIQEGLRLVLSLPLTFSAGLGRGSVHAGLAVCY
jgi:hypothetical protein